MDNRFSLSGKTILVTGASSGIGRGISIACSAMGAKLVITGRNIEKLQETKALLTGENHIIIPADLTDHTQRDELAKNVPMLNGVVHCAGVGSRVLCKMLDDRDVNSVMLTNFESPILLQAELLREKRIKKEGSIVFIGSAAATMPSIGNAVYSASKAAIIASAKCLSLELAPQKIRVNCISPAMVWTDLALVGATGEQLREAEQKYPLKRYGQPQDIANAAIYLLSDTSCWVTGSNIEITGGTLAL